MIFFLLSSLFLIAIEAPTLASNIECPSPAKQGHLLVSATTSFENSGLRSIIEDAFEKASSIDVSFLIAGSGQSLRIAAMGDSDAVLSHHEEAEQEFMARDSFFIRLPIMESRFFLIAPRADPCVIKDAPTIAEAFRRLATSCGRFLSRGDNSGTHYRERQLWQAVGIDPQEISSSHYMESGRGMGATLTMAAELQAYSISDSGTWNSWRHKNELQHIMTDTKPNQYSLLITNPKRHPHTHSEEALCFAYWLTSDEGRKVIGSLRNNGEPLFTPSSKSHQD